jgi:pilus assembly protein CpaB
MLLRNSLLFLGLLSVLVGTALSLLRPDVAPPSHLSAPLVAQQEMLVAAHPIAAGSLLRAEDLAWQTVASNAVFRGSMLRSEQPKENLLGAVVRRDFAAGEPLLAAALVKPGDRGFLAAVLAPGDRAVSISVDAPQSGAGLILPGDHVDVILTQSFAAAEKDAPKHTVGETVLRDLRVIAVDQRISATEPPQRGASTDARMPQTITLELTQRQAEVLVVCTQLGRIELSLRSLARSTDETAGTDAPVWSSDVSPALRAMSGPHGAEAPKVEVMHGAKTETR